MDGDLCKPGGGFIVGCKENPVYVLEFTGTFWKVWRVICGKVFHKGVVRCNSRSRLV